MPLELGIFIGAKMFGGVRQKEKQYLVLDSDRYRYLQFISDLGGQDPKDHNNDPFVAIRRVRSFLNSYSKTPLLGATAIETHYKDYLDQRPALLEASKLIDKDVEYRDTTQLMEGWVNYHLS